MENNSQKILIDQKDYKSIIIDFLKYLDSENERFNYGEDILQATVASFLSHAVEEFMKKLNNKKVKSDLAWDALTNEYDVSKTMFSKKLKPFINKDFKRYSILRDIGNAYSLMSLGFYKETVILSGSIIEEILRLFLEFNNMLLNAKTFNDYIKICEQNGLFRKGINKLADSVREFRNLVHLSKENSKKDVINKANAKNAISAIFSFYNEL